MEVSASRHFCSGGGLYRNNTFNPNELCRATLFMSRIKQSESRLVLARIPLSLRFSRSSRLPVLASKVEGDLKPDVSETVETSVDLETIKVTFLLERECKFGEQFSVAGDDPLLGSWDPTSSRDRGTPGKICKFTVLKNITGRGVDANCNWGVSWGNREKDYDPNEENPGTEPFSEPEVRILQQVAKSFRPHLWVNVHSGMQALFMPYDHKRAIPDDAGGEIMNYLLNNLNRLHCNNSCVVGSGGGSVGYVAHGTATDYMYDSLGVPIALTFEIYGDLEAHDADCFRMFNPTTSVVLEKVVSNWSSLLLALILDLPNALKSMPNSQKWDNVLAGLDEQDFSRSYSFTGRKGRLFWHEPFKQDWHIHSSGNHERTLPMLNVLCILVAFSWLVYKVLRCRRIWRVSR